MLISIIMPAYNTSAFIAEAVESVISQTYSNWELIIVNDGSTDNTLEIAKKLAPRDSRIKLVDQANQGVSVARNTGIKNSAGKYISFLDSDDYYFPNFLEELVSLAEATDCDIAYCGFIDEKIQKECGAPYAEGNLLECYALHKQNIWMNAFIIKRSILQAHNLWFEPKRLVCQDQEFILKCGVYCSIKAVTKPLCFYRHNGGSATNTWTGKKYRNDYKARQAAIDYIAEYFNSPYKKQVINYIEILRDTMAHIYQKAVWEAIVEDKKYDEVLEDLKNYGKLAPNSYKKKFKYKVQRFIINTQNKILWKFISYF